MHDVYVVAGSNIDPVRRLKEALACLQADFGPLRVSPAYRNKTVGFAGEDFVNLAIGFTTDKSPAQVIERLQAAEARCGRPRDAPKWAARAMDLDIVLYGDLVRDEPGLTLPRPDLVRRAYMLKPMADIAPDVVHPTLGRRLAELWQQSADRDHALVPIDLDAP
jgi:2-amino-4-hydroxy-6-hydroxymethyldihydropteridine diphosphokinase